MSATITGFQEFEKATAELAQSMAVQAAGGPPRKAPLAKGNKNTGHSADSSSRLEDAIEEFAPQYEMSPAFLRSMVHAARGVFSPGLHLVMANGTAKGSFTVNARLQESGRYLDASPAVVASRFGVKPQRWTIVATVSHYPEATESVGMASIASQIENKLADDFNRTRFIRTMNASVRDMAKSGLIDCHNILEWLPYRSLFIGP